MQSLAHLQHTNMDLSYVTAALRSQIINAFIRFDWAVVIDCMDVLVCWGKSQ